MQIRKDKIIRTIENIVLNWLIRVSMSNLYDYFIGESFKTINL